MFTGIIASRGIVVMLEPHRLVIDAPGIDEALGASVAIDGCCLTVTNNEPAPGELAPWPSAAPVATRRLSFDILPETISRTRLRSLESGAALNLEPALRSGEPLGGHLVQGHVDGVATVRASRRDPDGRWLDVELDLPGSVLRYCIERGSITVNGASLTVMQLDDSSIRVQLIPESQERTNLGSVVPGDLVNVEADVIARYVERLMPTNR